ncbi:MAG TPA: YihY/virulence factor BrkB family protein [Mycobacteriales bacterium]|nr:YihY/virulence factor BrkB family protein [Mycobacteriales bacterium]
MDVAERLDRFQRRHPAAGFPLAVIYKFVDDQGNYLTAMITYYGFLSVFPLLLLLTSILGFALHNDPGLQERVLDSALSRFPVIGQQLGENVQSLHGSTVAVVVGLIGGLYGSLGVIQAAQNAFNKVWAVPRNARPNPVKSRLRSLLVLAVIGVGVVVSTALSALTTVADRLGNTDVGAGLRVAATGASIVLNVALLVFAFRLLTGESIGIRDQLPGAVTAALGWQALQSAGTYYLGHSLQNASATYGLFGIVIGLVVWLYLTALTVILCAEINVVRARRLWPRSLLTPFTDDVRLTRGDRKAYESYAVTERHKGFESVDVDFDQPPPEEEPARRDG